MADTTTRAPGTQSGGALRARLASAGRLALVASVVPLAAFIGWLAMMEPRLMLLLAVALPIWIAADCETQGLAPSPSRGRPSHRARVATRPAVVQRGAI